MKLLICSSEYYPNGSGIANVAYNIVEQLKKKGINCTVCSPTGPDIAIGSSRLIERCGIVGLLYYWYAVHSYFKKHDFDVVWVHNPLFLKTDPFKKAVVTLNSTYYGKMTRKIEPILYNIIASKIEYLCLNKMNPQTTFVAVGHGIGEQLKASCIHHNIVYIPNGVDTKKFKPAYNKQLLREKFKLPPTGTILLSVGRLVELKKPLDIIKLFHKISAQLENIILVFAGNGNLLINMKKYVAVHKINNVYFLGKVNSNLPDLYACSDYFITASQYEGGEPTLTIAEAIASGLPCITSNIPSFKIVQNVDVGINIDFLNENEATKKVIDYLKLDYSNLSNKSRIYAIDNLDWEIISSKYLEIMEKIHK